MVGKLTATLKEALPHKEIMTVEMVQGAKGPTPNYKIVGT